jgi:hypothetical protein
MLFTLTCLLAGCQSPSPAAESHGAAQRSGAAIGERDLVRERCQHLIEQTLASPDPGGAPAFERRRGEILGRAYGSALTFVRPPRATPSDALTPAAAAAADRSRKLAPVRRIARQLAQLRGRRAALRQLMLREGYLYSDDPIEARWLVHQLTIGALFDAPALWLERGAQRHRLIRRLQRRQALYRHADGPLAGQTARLLFGDRLATTPGELATPLHRDWRGARRQHGFDRVSVLHHGPGRLVAELRFDGQWLRALMVSHGPALELECLDASAEDRRLAEGAAERLAWRRRAVSQLQTAVQAMVAERLPFDRPRGVEDHLSDGQLRPLWNSAYRRGAHSFEHDDKRYPVFDSHGRAAPPQMCVEFIIDGYERAAGTWYSPRGEARRRSDGRLDFNALGIRNRAGVLAFERFARSQPTLFRATRFGAGERVPFAKRARFFGFLMRNADRFRPGDIVAIQGRKRDGYIHQHAILIEDVDPVSGFPHALADQMRAPRRRSWEAIMAEAPARSLLFHLRPTRALLERLALGGDARLAPVATARASSSAPELRRSREPAWQ